MDRTTRILKSTYVDPLETMKLVHSGNSAINIEDFYNDGQDFRITGYILRETEDVKEDTGEIVRYKTLIFKTVDDTVVRTSSEPFIRTFTAIMDDADEMGMDRTELVLKVYRGESMMYKGKHYYHAIL